MILFPEGGLARPIRLMLTVAATVGVCLVLNVLIFSLGWDKDAAPGTLLPQGATIGMIWIVLFALLGAARWCLAEAGTADGDEARLRVDILLTNCALYPFYTLGLSSQVLGLGGNVVTLWVAGRALLSACQVSRLATLLLLPVLPWVAFATIGVMHDLWGRG
jgi:tryptophan-rich sensory protein